ncbi:hypothetical protein V6N13_011437 [Hibiscus sabdariffa]
MYKGRRGGRSTKFDAGLCHTHAIYKSNLGRNKALYLRLINGRPLGPYTEGRNLIMSIRALAAREALKIGRTENEINNLYESKRVSPGGPDPQHHSIHH